MRFAKLASVLAQHRRSSAWWLAGGVDPADCVAAYQPKGAADLAASYVNLANPGTYNASVPTGKDAPSFAAGIGWTHDGATQVLTTGLILPAGDVSFIIDLDNGYTTERIIAGSLTPAEVSIYPGGAARVTYFEYNGQEISFSGNTDTANILALTPAGGYKNGTKRCSFNPTTRGASSSPFAIGGVNQGAIWQSYPCVIRRLAIYLATLTDDQVFAITEAP